MGRRSGSLFFARNWNWSGGVFGGGMLLWKAHGLTLGAGIYRPKVGSAPSYHASSNANARDALWFYFMRRILAYFFEAYKEAGNYFSVGFPSLRCL